jgi:outer membrane lipoprotein carrier protein
MTKSHLITLSFFPSCLLLFLLLLTDSAIAIKEPPEAVATRLQSRYDTIESLTFDFVQRTSGQLSGRPKKGRGQAFFVKETIKENKTGKMRWNYSAPDRQVLVSDGVNFSMYFESLQQMIISPAKALQQDLTYSFFTGAGNLLHDFTILPPDKSSDNPEQSAVIKLIPKAKQSQVAEIHLWVTPDSLIRRIEILDQFDTLTVLNFSNLQVDTLDKSDMDLMLKLFSFTPPNGTEIIHQ